MLKVIVYLKYIFLFYFPINLFRFSFHRYQTLFDRVPTLLELEVNQQNCFRGFSEILNRNSEKMYSRRFLTFLMRCFAGNPDLQLLHIRKQPLKNFAIFSRKQLCWSLFSIRHTTLLKRDSNRGVCFPVNIGKF